MKLRSAALALAAVALAATPLVAQAPVALKTTELGRGPAVVLVPGLGGDRMQWMPTARKLLGGHRVILVDLPGHGDSPMPDPFTFEVAAEALDAVVAKQTPESTIVVGHGIGGILAVLVARKHPGHVRGVVVVDAGLKSPFASIPDQQRRQFMEFLNGSPENYDLFVKRMFTSLGRDSAQGVEIHSRAARVPSLSMRTYFRELMFMDYSEVAKQLSTPFLYVGSSRSWADTLSWATVARERGLEGIAGAASRRIPDSGHLIMSDQPDSLAAAIADFTRRALASK